MDIKNLTQFNKRAFKKMLGVYIRETRIGLGWSAEQACEKLALSATEIQQIESGQKTLTQSSFDYIRLALNLSDKEIYNIAKITQAQHLMDVYKELDEHFPK